MAAKKVEKQGESDVIKLNDYLSDEEKLKEIGSRVITALIRDILKMRFGLSPLSYDDVRSDYLRAPEPPSPDPSPDGPTPKPDPPHTDTSPAPGGKNWRYGMPYSTKVIDEILLEVNLTNEELEICRKLDLLSKRV